MNRTSCRLAALVSLAAAVWGCRDAAAPATGRQISPARSVGRIETWDHRFLFDVAAPEAPAWPALWVAEPDGTPPVRLAERSPSLHFLAGSRLFAWDVSRGMATFDASGPPVAWDAVGCCTAAAVRSDGGAIAGFDPDHAGSLVVGVPGQVGPVQFPTGSSATVDDRDNAIDWGWLGGDLAFRAHVADGPAALFRADPATRIASPLVAPPIGPRFALVGCGLDTAACADGTAPRCLVAYTRTGVDGTSLPYLWDVGAGAEIALPALAPVEGFFASPDGHTLVWHDPTPLMGGSNRVWFLDTCSPLVADLESAQANPDRCRVVAGQIMRLLFRPDGLALAFALDEPGDLQTLDLTTRPRRTCSSAGLSQRIGTFGFSPDSRRMAWIDRSGTVGSLWFSEGLGRLRTHVADGDFVPSILFTSDASRLLVGRIAELQTSLIWYPLDPLAGLQPEHAITSSHLEARAGARRVLLTADFATQEKTGDLVLVDLDSGARTLLARSVATFAVDGDVDGPATVAFATHGRYPSGSDGLWLATLPP